MDAATFYRLRGPSSWAKLPDHYSFSSLRVIEECPRRWLLERSCYEELERFPQRPYSATESGTIIHSALEYLFCSLAKYGQPAIGSPAFRDAMKALNLIGFLQKKVEEHIEEVSLHPRAAGYRVSFTARELYNKVVPLFQAEYKPLPESAIAHPIREVSVGNPLEVLLQSRALSELSLQHPTLPFKGVIDLVLYQDGTRLVDFKSGKEKPEHKLQLELYGVLWWRVTGDIPVALEVRYLNAAKVFELNEARLLEVEASLASQIQNARRVLSAPPGVVQLGEHCKKCAVRQFCGDYWGQLPVPSSGWVDAELLVTHVQNEYGFLGKLASGEELKIVSEHALGEVSSGERLRILGARWQKKELHITPTTEIFHC